MRCRRRRRVMSLSDSAARTQGKAGVDRERRLCVHLGLNVIRTPRRARHKTNDKQLFVRMFRQRVYWPYMPLFIL